MHTKKTLHRIMIKKLEDILKNRPETNEIGHSLVLAKKQPLVKHSIASE